MAKKDLPKGLRAEDLELDPLTAPMAAGTLAGDVRDVMLSQLRAIKVPWAMLGEDEQTDRILTITNCAHDLVRRSTQAIAEEGFTAVQVTIGAIKIDRGLEIKLGASGTVENITNLAQHGKGAAVLVLVEAADYFGERAPAKADKDQPDLPMDEK